VEIMGMKATRYQKHEISRVLRTTISYTKDKIRQAPHLAEFVASDEIVNLSEIEQSQTY
jgi:hypothetical protein